MFIVAESSAALIRRYLEHAITAEKHFETELRNLAAQGDDDEVQGAFREAADRGLRHQELLRAQLSILTASPSIAPEFSVAFLDWSFLNFEGVRVEEERTAKNLIRAYGLTNAGCALYAGLSTYLEGTREAEIRSLASEFQGDYREAAERIFRFIPSRSKIAFNMLTISETDPAVETKAPGNRIV